MERAGQGKPQLALWADKVAAWFVAALLVLAVLVFIGWQLTDPGRAWRWTAASRMPALLAALRFRLGARLCPKGQSQHLPPMRSGREFQAILCSDVAAAGASHTAALHNPRKRLFTARASLW
mgnify:CR=1 FL=1